MNADEIRAIKERAERATEGPWEEKPGYSVVSLYRKNGPRIGDIGDSPYSKRFKDQHKQNAEFIAHARKDIPDLCAALEEAMAEIEKLEKQKALWATANHILTVIAEGYPAKGEGDRYVVVENPNYRPDNGSEPNIVYDCGD